MLDEFFLRVKASEMNGTHPEIEVQRQELIAFYESQDTKHHGYLTLDEFLKLPLENFDCVDVKHDGVLSQDEIANGVFRCPSLNLEDYAQKR